MTTKIARKTVPTKQARKQAPAKPAQSANERGIRSALASAKSPGEASALLAVIERSSEIMAKTLGIMNQLTETNQELTKVLQLKRGLISLQASGHGIR
jgi:hypothetical protein